MLFSQWDYQMMSLALTLAKKGIYNARPNPMVGCVISRQERIVATGYHQQCGGAHAEIEALKQAGASACGSTVYVTLEPCSYTGRTPPCTDALIKAQVRRVVAAVLDPNPKVCGSGLDQLKQAGIEVENGLLAADAECLNRDFFKRMREKKPFVLAKAAVSLDGNMALKDGTSQWITSPSARLDVQRLRAKSGAILTGSGTVLTDNPKLTVREIGCVKQPLRVVLDTTNRLLNKHDELHIFTDGGDTLVLTEHNTQLADDRRLDLQNVLTKLAELEINTVLVEAGHTLLSALLSAHLVDELILYMAPIMLGKNAQNIAAFTVEKMAERLSFNLQEVRCVGDDMRLTLSAK